MHQLNRFASSPALSTHHNNNNNNNNTAATQNYYNALTPKTSYDSMTSMRSIGSNNSAGSNSTGGGGIPWSPYGQQQPPSTPNTSINSQPQIIDFSSSRNNMSFFDNNNSGYFNRPHPNNNTDVMLDNQRRHSSEIESLYEQQKTAFNNPFTPMITSPQRNNNNNNTFHNYYNTSSSSSSGAPPLSSGGNAKEGTINSNNSNNTIHQVDPAIDQAFKNMAKSLEEKEAIINDLKTQIEAILAATTSGKLSKNEKTILENATNRKIDGNEMAHRIVMKLQTLKEENETLGRMLSQGRAAQKEVELGILKRENTLLKNRVEQLENGEQPQQSVAVEEEGEKKE